MQVKAREIKVLQLQKRIADGEAKLKHQQVPAKQFAEINNTIRRDAHALT